MASPDLKAVTEKLIRQNQEELSASFSAATDQLQSAAARQALAEVADILGQQEGVSVKEFKETKKKIDLLDANLAQLEGATDQEKKALQEILRASQESIKQNTTFKKSIGDLATKTVESSISGIGGVITGALSGSPLLAFGTSFVGDRIKQFRETRKANKAEEEERQRRIVEQRKIEEEEFSVLRTQISNEEAISRANITSEEVATQALARGITEQEVIDEQKNAIIRQAKIAKEAEDANKAREDEIESIKRSYGLDMSESPISVTQAESPISVPQAESPISVPQAESPISDDRENITIPSPSPSENVQSLSTEEASAPSEISQITATKLDEVKEQLGENSPYLEEVVNLLKFLQDTSDNPSPLDLENQREGNRERKIEQELEKKQIKLLEQIAENTGNLDEISGEGGGLLDGLLGGLGGLGGGLLGGAAGRGRGGIRGAISRAGGAVRGGLGRAGGAVRGGLGRVGSVANRASGGRFGRLGNLIRNAGSGITGRARSLVGGGLNVARGALGGIKRFGANALKLGGGAVAGLAATGAMKTASAASNVMSSMPDSIKGIGNAIPDNLPKMPNISTPPKMPSVMDKITAPAKGVGARISGLASRVTGKGAASVATKGAATAGKTAGKGLGKSLLKKIPGVGLIAGLGFGAQRAFSGDFSGAGLEVLSGLTSIVPGFGTAASAAIDGGLMAKDMGAFDGKEGAVPEVTVEDQKADLQAKIAEAKDRISRSESGENVYWGRDSKGREEDAAELEKLQSELDKLNVSVDTSNMKEPSKEEWDAMSPAEKTEHRLDQKLREINNVEKLSTNFTSSDVPNKKLQASNMMDSVAMDKSTAAAKQAANIINAPQQNTVNNVTNNSTIMPKQKPEVRHTDGAVRDARLSLVGAW
jgi:hypothetical protein